MPYDPGLAERLAELVAGRPGFRLKKMFGGIGWMLNGNMCVGVWREWLIVRAGEDATATICQDKGVKPMDLTGRPMKGWAMAGPEAVASDAALARYVELAAGFVSTLPEKE